MTPITNSERVEMARQFLDRLYSVFQSPVYSYLWILRKPKEGKKQKYSYYFDVSKPNERAKMAATAIDKNDDGFNVFFGVNLLNTPKNKFERATENDIVAQVAVIADIDIESAWHISDKKNNYPKDIKTAASLLPFQPSTLVDSGGGIHAYNLFDTPLHFADSADREKAKERNSRYIDCIRKKGSEYTSIDGVGDLPRVLRMVGTYNLKNGKENAPLVKVLETKEKISCSVFDNNIADFQATFKPAETQNEQNIFARVADHKVTTENSFDDPPEYTQDLIQALLDDIEPAALSDTDWLSVMAACKNESVPYSVVDSWNSRDQKRYNEKENQRRWDSLNNQNFGIETLVGKAHTLDIKNFKRQWYDNHQQYQNSNYKKKSSDSLKDIKAELSQVLKQLADFDAEKQAAIETVRNAETFDKDFVFSDDMIHAAAFSKLYDNGTFSDLKSAIQNHIKAQKIPPFLTEWQGEIKIAAEKILSRLEELQTLKNELQSRITNAEFVAHNNVMKDFTIPENFIVHRDKGILRPHKKQLLTVCRRPIIVTEKFKSLDDSTIKYSLAHRMKNGDWKFLKPMPASDILNPRKLADLADLELPVTGANSLGVVDWIDAFITENESKIPLTKTVRRGGWHKLNGKNYFLDPRRKCEYDDTNGGKCKVVVEENNFTKGLTAVGSLDEWRKTYELIKPYPVARFIVAASIAAPLLKVLDERTFILYTFGRTTSGKSTALKFGASAFGNPEKVVRNFNGTTKGLAELATLTDNYSLLIDEKQAADEKLRDNFIQLVYNLAEEQGRTRLDSNADLRTVENWKSIILMNGEEPLHDDNATAGSFTRVLSLAIKEKILPSDICKEVWHTIRNNFGLIFNLYIDEILKYGIEKLPEKYADIVSVICDLHPDLLPEYARYLAVIIIADFFLNLALGVDKKTAFDNAVIYVNEKIIPLIPTIKDIDETSRHRDFVLSFISRYAPHFIGSDFYRSTSNLKPYGKYDREKGYLFIDAAKLNEYCTEKGYSSKIVAGNLVADGFFVPADTVEKGRKTPLNTVKERIGESVRCYRIKLETLNKDEDI